MAQTKEAQILCMKRFLETEGTNDETLVKVFKNLSKIQLTVDLLQSTGIGKLVNGFRKQGGKVGEKAKALVLYWKNVVSSSVTEEKKMKAEAERKAAERESTKATNLEILDLVNEKERMTKLQDELQLLRDKLKTTRAEVSESSSDDEYDTAVPIFNPTPKKSRKTKSGGSSKKKERELVDSPPRDHGDILQGLKDDDDSNSDADERALSRQRAMAKWEAKQRAEIAALKAEKRRLEELKEKRRLAKEKKINKLYANEPMLFAPDSSMTVLVKPKPKPKPKPIPETILKVKNELSVSPHRMPNSSERTDESRSSGKERHGKHDERRHERSHDRLKHGHDGERSSHDRKSEHTHRSSHEHKNHKSKSHEHRSEKSHERNHDHKRDGSRDHKSDKSRDHKSQRSHDNKSDRSHDQRSRDHKNERSHDQRGDSDRSNDAKLHKHRSDKTHESKGHKHSSDKLDSDQTYNTSNQSNSLPSAENKSQKLNESKSSEKQSHSSKHDHKKHSHDKPSHKRSAFDIFDSEVPHKKVKTEHSSDTSTNSKMHQEVDSYSPKPGVSGGNSDAEFGGVDFGNDSDDEGGKDIEAEQQGLSFEDFLNYDANSKAKSKSSSHSKERSHKSSSHGHHDKHRGHSRGKDGEKTKKHLPSSDGSRSQDGESSDGKKFKPRRSTLTLSPLDIPQPSLKMNLSQRDILSSVSSLPQTQTDYKPVHFPDMDGKSRHAQTLDEVDDYLIGTKKKNKTQVYSGRKTTYLTEVPRLYDACMRVLTDNIDSLECIGGVPYDVIKPVLEKCTASQLYTLEDYNPHLVEDSDELWQLHCKKDFRKYSPEEMENWRELYLRLHDEREARLKKLTTKVSASMAAKLPVRTTQLAYVDTAAKAPREVLRRQRMLGTAGPMGKNLDPLARLSSHGGLKKYVKPSDVETTKPRTMKPVAPMMAKTLKMIKKCRR